MSTMSPVKYSVHIDSVCESINGKLLSLKLTSETKTKLFSSGSILYQLWSMHVWCGETVVKKSNTLLKLQKMATRIILQKPIKHLMFKKLNLLPFGVRCEYPTDVVVYGL